MLEVTVEGVAGAGVAVVVSVDVELGAVAVFGAELSAVAVVTGVEVAA